ILDCHAEDRVLRDRIRQRKWDGADGSEIDEAVLKFQQKSLEPLSDEEKTRAISVDTAKNKDPLRIAGEIWSKLGREISV
ncbi:MAG: hypothetical protein HKM98_03705, partial [Gammaproteobacteria bacterium]|nr:hypothetical protein [Gammaproteobacteria bacterium]